MNVVNQSGAYHISNNKVEYNPQRKSNFKLIVHGLDNLLRVGEAADGASIVNGQEEIIIGLKSCTTPKVDLGNIEINRGNSKIKFAGKPTFNDISLEAYDFIGSDVKDTFLAWQNLAYNTRNDVIGKARSYKKSCQLYEYTPAGEPVRYWDLEGCWLKNVDPGDFSMDEDGVMTVKATMSIDWAEMHMPDDEE